MAVLPDPRDRSPVSGSAYIARRGAAIERARRRSAPTGAAACFL